MIARRGFLGALAAAWAGFAHRAEGLSLEPNPRARAHEEPDEICVPLGNDFDGFCLTVDGAGGGWIHKLRLGDPYPARFGQGWVANGSYHGEWTIRWHDGKNRVAHMHRGPCTPVCGRSIFHPLALGEALYNRDRPVNGKGFQTFELRFALYDACAALARLKNRQTNVVVFVSTEHRTVAYGSA